MSSYLEKIEAKAKIWQENGKQNRDLLHGYDFMAAYCWSFNNEMSCSNVAREFIQQSYIAQGGSAGWDSFLRGREYCDRCGERYRLENLSICTGCKSTYCYRCSQSCSCDGQVVG